MLQESCKNTQEENRQAQMWRWIKDFGFQKKLKKENKEKQIEKTETKKREDEGEELKKKMKERKVGSKR
jgi:hypothetical protein